MQASTIILLGIIGIIMGVNYYIKNKDVVSVRSSIDGREYRIADSPDRQEAADLLADVNRDIIKFVDYLRNNPDENIQRICNRYNPDKFGENLGIFTAHILNLLDPSIVSFGGGISKAFKESISIIDILK